MDKKQQIMDLWRTCFDDSDEFLRIFFDRVYDKHNALVIEKNGQVVSSLQMLPYTMTYYGTEISVSYLYGACTLPAERGQGLMKELVEKAFEEMKYRDVALTVVIPAEPRLFDFYRKLGYTEAFDYSEEHYTRPATPIWEPNLTVVPPLVPSMQILYDFFNRKLRERTCCVLHTYDDFVTILRDFHLIGGEMLTALDDLQQPVGLAFVLPDQKNKESSPEERSVYIREILYDTDRIKDLLLQEATLQNNVKKAIVRTPAYGPNTYRLGMARVLDTHRLIRHWASTHDNTALSIHEMEKMEVQPLTRLLLDYPAHEAYMSLMLD